MSGWKTFLEQEHKQTYLQDTLSYVAQRRAEGIAVYPEDKHVFEALNVTDLSKVKVVILGQDPYHGPEQAHGLCFSVLPGIKPPPSLANMYKELVQDVTDFTIPEHGFLLSWAEQGVLLLNTVLTVEQAKAHSHAKSGWETFTANALTLLNQQPQSIIFVLWGAHAIKKGKGIDAPQHEVLSGPHPSPLSAYRGFFGCQHFSKVNQLLQARAETPINWQV